MEGGGGAREVLPLQKGGQKKFWGSFYAKSFYSLKGGARKV